MDKRVQKTSKRREETIAYWTCGMRGHIPPNYFLKPDPSFEALSHDVVAIPAWHATETEAKECMALQKTLEGCLQPFTPQSHE